MYFLLKMGDILHCYVSLPEGIFIAEKKPSTLYSFRGESIHQNRQFFWHQGKGGILGNRTP